MATSRGLAPSDRPVRKTVHNLHAIAAHGAHCALAVDTGDRSFPYSVMLATAVGAPVDLQYTDFRPSLLAMASHTVVAADEHTLFVWSFLSPHNRARDVRGPCMHPHWPRRWSHPPLTCLPRRTGRDVRAAEEAVTHQDPTRGGSWS